MALTPIDIIAQPDVVALLGWPFDFELDAKLADRAPDFTVAGNSTVEIIARDGSDNSFALVGEPGDTSRPLLFVDHEASAGVIGRSLEEGLQIIVALPYWRDLLKFSGGQDLEEMRRSQTVFEEDFEDHVDLGEHFDLEEARARIRSALALAPLADPVATLHANVGSFEDRFRVTFNEGDTCESLFGSAVYRPETGYRLDGGAV